MAGYGYCVYLGIFVNEEISEAAFPPRGLSMNRGLYADVGMSLEDLCAKLGGACSEAGEWVRRNTDLVRNEEESLLKELRHAGRQYRILGRAAGRKMCAGVFGPSQAGKSYLISALARDSQGFLMARFGAEKHDFIQEINPEGGKESTGLVTRFTLSEPAKLTEGFPVQVRLLSETDLVKIVANTFYADCEHKEEDQSDVQKTLELLKTRRRKDASHIDLDAMEDLREYLNRDFRSKARVAMLDKQYWPEALALGPCLGLEDRLLLYALIWDEVPEFTRLLGILFQALEQLGHPDLAYCPMSALTPRESSIIDVATLEGLENGTADGETLEMISADGKKATLPRAVVTALTAELTIVMDQQPAPYFQTTDLLDFPGYRSRYKIDNIRHELAKPGMLKEMFLRGKVAYLFQRYCNEHELTSMLLCIGPSNQEVQDLPGVINDWVCSTHGDRPELRDNHPVSLFLVLTKFDMEFEQKKGAPSVESRWDNRLHASLLDFFGKQHDWPREWDSKGAFRNLFLLRNPNFRFDAILDYDAEGHEKGVRSEMQGYVQSLEQAFMNSQLVASHFANPRVSWDAAMRLNDGGISYIRESLSPLCNPELKDSQLSQAITEISAKLHNRLKIFYRSDDREELLKQKLGQVKVLFARLGALQKNYQRMGKLLRSFTLRDADIFDMYPEALRNFLEDHEDKAKESETGPETPAEVDITEVDLESWNPFSDSPDHAQQAAEVEPERMDEAAFFAKQIEQNWISHLRDLASDPAMQKYFQLSAQEFSDLVGELGTGCARLELRKAMLDAFHKASAYVNTQKESILWQQSSMAAHIINHYVSYLGFDPESSEQERTIKAGANTVVVFTPPKSVTGMVELGTERSNYLAGYLRDWLHALYALVVGNVNFDGQTEINMEENLALGTLLQHFSATPR